jgi:hypothetical protein
MLLKTVSSAPWRRCYDDVTFGVQENLIISETVYIRRTTSLKHNQKTLGGLPECGIRNCVQRPLAVIATWHPIRLQDNVNISETVHDGSKVTIEHE